MDRGTCVAVSLKICNFHKNQDRTFVKVLFWRGGTELFLKKSVVPYDTAS